MRMVPGAYLLSKLTMVRGIGPEPPPPKLGPPPKISRRSKPWARAGLTPASMVTAANRKAKAPIMFPPQKKRIRGERGNNWRDFASHGRVSFRFSNAAVAE